MKAQRVVRPKRKTAEERASERALREKLRQEKPPSEAGVDTGTSDPAAALTLRMYSEVRSALQALRGERERSGLTIAEVADRSGLDRTVVSRLENGKEDNPTIATLMRYAAAIGKRLKWSYEDVAPKVADGNDVAEERQAKSGA